MRSDVLAIIARHDPALWTGTLRRRAKVDLPFDASRVPEGGPLLFDTSVYIDQLKGDLPKAIVSLISSRTIFHATPALAEIAVTVGALNPTDERTKDTLQPILRVRALPRDERQLMIAANNGHMLAFDNLSGVSPWLSDALCRLASGGSFAVRRLYTDDEEVLFRAARPTLLNGIEDVIGRADLADRAIFLTLQPILEGHRRSETELWRAFELARPRILGALLDAVVHGLRALGSVQVDRLPRMADFALWATACETGLWLTGTFARAYRANRKGAVEGMIEADPIAACVRELMSERSFWKGLLRISGARAGPESNTAGPKTPRALAGRLRRAQTFLRALGIDIAFAREGRAGSRVIRICKFLRNTVSTVSKVGSLRPSGSDPGQATIRRHAGSCRQHELARTLA